MNRPPGLLEWRERLTQKLEPILLERDPRPRLSAYHDMPYAIFYYPPSDEWELRRELGLLGTRLAAQAGKRVTHISLSECLAEALEQEGLSVEALAQAERFSGTASMAETLHAVLTEYRPLHDLVAARVPDDADPLHDIVFIARTGALFPVYRTSSLLEQMQGAVTVPAVLFYPGELDGASGLRFMGVLDAEHNYRPRIF